MIKYTYMIYYFWYVFLLCTCVLVECKKGRAPSWCCAVGHPAVHPRVRVAGGDFDDRCSGRAVGAEADRVEDWIESGTVVIDVHHQDPHSGN